MFIILARNIDQQKTKSLTTTKIQLIVPWYVACLPINLYRKMSTETDSLVDEISVSLVEKSSSWVKNIAMDKTLVFCYKQPLCMTNQTIKMKDHSLAVGVVG